MVEMAEGDVRPVPDPTELTTQAVNEAKEYTKEYTNSQISIVNERLRGIDRAAELLERAVGRVPTDLQKEIAHLRELLEAFRELTSVQFEAIESWRKEQKSDTKAAVDAALAAAKEAVKEQTTASQLSINKSETSTAEQLKQQNVTFNTANAGLTREIGDIKERVGKIENLKLGGQENKAAVYGAIATIGVVILVLLAILGFLATRVQVS